MTPRDEILSWYRTAALKLINSPSPTSTDAEYIAVNQLLQRQATSLLRIHDAKDTSTHTINQDLLKRRLDDITSISTSKFYAYRYDLLPSHWREIHTDALILTTFHEILTSLTSNTWLEEHVLDHIVELLDRAVITAGGAGILGTKWIEQTLQLLERLSPTDEPDEPPAKKAKLHTEFSSEEPYGRPVLSPQRSCPIHKAWSLTTFERYMNSHPPRPIIFTDLVATWPALTDHPWKSPEYLLSQTFNGRRLIPVEIGRSYVDPNWGQELIPFKDFLSRYITPSKTTGYLAQHDLFTQIPSLRGDISTPDLCWSSVPLHPTDKSKNKEKVDVPRVNAWFGPARTITPLHTDAYHNLLVQVVGTKYVRLYPPWSDMRPRGVEDGVDMSNTSALDVGVLEGWDEGEEGMSEGERESLRAELEGEEYWECILGERDTLLIPMGWWHYVRSLSVSFSVSFWWN
ncbi:jumonji domain-containing 5 [Pochonia chlamydosporia 170]|uniref:Jumonji domain-containing 5 n=1 Tax=Pochonia chlamydosporia 170 TaxID=1380566 RepID=A0A179F2G2_METCM|nr:jumonji domain-containing 5 [Pochonia chlamydosporia 170]OAQ59624.1 jumonji domain-containing 5 [Pochonia chlamydosporia 170]